MTCIAVEPPSLRRWGIAVASVLGPLAVIVVLLQPAASEVLGPPPDAVGVALVLVASLPLVVLDVRPRAAVVVGSLGVAGAMLTGHSTTFEALALLLGVRQVSVATGSKLVIVAGQVAWRTDGTTVGIGDLAAQVEQCSLNVATVLAAVGASSENVAKWTVYAADGSLDEMPLFEEGVARAARRLGVDPPRVPGSLIGISAGFTPELLVEVEAMAIVD